MTAAPDPVVTRTDILAASAGMLQMPLWVVFTEPTSGLGAVMDRMEEHLAYQVDLERRGIMLGAGPFFREDDTWGGEGMVIVRATDRAAAEAIAEADPMHASGARRWRLRPWLLNEGAISATLRFSTGRVEVT